MKPKTINEFADYYSIEPGTVILAVITYLVDAPTVVHPRVREPLLEATPEPLKAVA